MPTTDKIAFIAGATGYVGGRLTKKLCEKGYSVRCLARRPEQARQRLPQSAVIVSGDVLNKSSLTGKLKGVHTAYYLVHSMGEKEDFCALEIQGAQNFADIAAQAGVKRIIYLGGLGQADDGLSAHLKSRQDVGRVLRSSNIPTIEFRASIVIGSGSLSFEMIRQLTEKLPLMITPKWVRVKAQPIAIEDLIEYLVQAIDLAIHQSQSVEIGGTDVVSYGELMREYARQRRLRRIFVAVPVLTPRLSSLWLGLVTPLYARIGHKLITSLRNPTVVQDTSGSKQFRVQPMGVQKAIQRALKNEDSEMAQSHWADAISSLGRPKNWAGVIFGSRIIDRREIEVSQSVEGTFSFIQAVGGNNGWFASNFLWRVRGALDRLLGGPGLRRGRRHGYDVRVGDAIDFWRVEAFEPNRRLLLRAEMKVPGRAWLEFSVSPNNNKTRVRQTAIFDPIGVFGRLYWYALFPIHAWIFRGMLSQIKRTAERSMSMESRAV